MVLAVVPEMQVEPETVPVQAICVKGPVAAVAVEMVYPVIPVETEAVHERSTVRVCAAQLSASSRAIPSAFIMAEWYHLQL